MPGWLDLTLPASVVVHLGPKACMQVSKGRQGAQAIHRMHPCLGSVVPDRVGSMSSILRCLGWQAEVVTSILHLVGRQAPVPAAAAAAVSPIQQQG